MLRKPNELASAIKTDRVSSIEGLEAHFRQIDKYNPKLNAVVTLDAYGARKRARHAEEALSRGVIWGPLRGMPFTLWETG